MGSSRKRGKKAKKNKVVDLFGGQADEPAIAVGLVDIEEIMAQHQRVRSCSALTFEQASIQSVVVYYTSRGNEPINKDELYQHLISHLSAYETPTFFVHLEKMPLKSDGSIAYDGMPLPRETDLAYVEKVVAEKGKDKSLPQTWTEASDYHRENLEESIRRAEGKFAQTAIPYNASNNPEAGPGQQLPQHPVLSKSPLHTGDATRINSMPTNTEEGRNELTNSLTNQNQKKLGMTSTPTPNPNPTK